jgi:hypothetical protein
MAPPVKSFADLQRELIRTQMQQRRAAERQAEATSQRALADDVATAQSSAALSVVEG